jgi:hypothetical protein
MSGYSAPTITLRTAGTKAEQDRSANRSPYDESE